MAGIKIQIRPPAGRHLAVDIEEHVVSVLIRAHLEFRVFSRTDEDELTVYLMHPNSSERNFVIRLLKRAGYDMIVEEISRVDVVIDQE